MPNNDDIINNILKELDGKDSADGGNETAGSVKTEDNSVSAAAAEAQGADSTAAGDKQGSNANGSDRPSDSAPRDIPADDAEVRAQRPAQSPEPNGTQAIRRADMNRPAGSRPSPQSPNQQRKRKKKKKKRSRLPGVLILVTLIFAVSISLSLVIIAFGKDMFGIGKSDSTKLIIVDDGATVTDIAYMLKDEGIIKSPKLFIYFTKLRKSDNNYIAGEHFVRPNMAYETIIDELTSNESDTQESVEITFPEGITIYDAAEILEENHICDADDFIFYFNSGGFGFSFESLLPTDSTLKFNRMEGYVFPDTYFFYENMDVEEVCQKIYLNFDNKMTDERYDKMKKLNLTLDELITFASIVQKEAASTDVMNLVASVFWNRLNHPDEFALLQSDPTTNYANFVIKPHMEVLNQTVVDAYDTYKSAGLPPGAICNPGIEAIDAVLNAIETDYYYFYANIYTGETRFATTLDEHNMNIEEMQEDIQNASIAQAEAEAAAAAAAEEAAAAAEEQEGAAVE